MSKYDQALAKYNTDLNDEAIKATVAKIIEEKVPQNDTVEVKKFLFGSIELTSLKPTDNDEYILKFTKKVNQFDDEYPDIPHVATICVYPNFASVVSNTLDVDGVEVACVSGGFPSSQTFLEVKIAETAMAIHDGATEIDMVLSVGKFLVCGTKRLKVILETGCLGSASNIKKAAILAMYSGADFIKTSTGKEKIAATPEAAYVMCQAIKEYYEETGRIVGFKPAGGLNTSKDAITYYTIVKEVLGEKWLTNDLLRLGTSRLANILLSEIEGEEVKFF